MKKTVLVTGASRGIGATIAKKFSEQNYNVIINYNKSGPEAEKLASSLMNAVAIKADVSNYNEVENMIITGEKIFGGIDILVNNAGIALQRLVTDVTDSEYNKIFDVNIKGVFNCVKAVLPYMISKKEGCIINISSVWGVHGASCETVYSASKAAIITFTKALAKEVGPSNIRVNCIAPGVIDTEMNKHLSKNDIDVLIEQTPLCRIGTTNDIAEASLFFASQSASFITGQILGVDGGFGI